MPRARCDYILGTNRRLFNLVGIRDMRNYFLDHFALRARLLQLPTQYDTHYLRGKRAFLLSLSAVVDLSMVDTKFQALKALESPPPCPP